MIFNTLTETPCYVRLAFLISDDVNRINFEIVGPKQNTLYSVDSKSHLYYNFNVSEPGEYIFSLDNRENYSNTRITFAINQGNSSDSHLSHEHLDRVWDKLSKINKDIKKSRFTARMLSKKYDRHYEETKSQNRKIVLLSIIETAIMSLIFFFQLCYIRSLANKINL